jgi:hypothetical protein
VCVDVLHVLCTALISIRQYAGAAPAQDTNEQEHVRRRNESIQRTLVAKYAQTKHEISASMQDILTNLKQMESCFEILIPHTDRFDPDEAEEEAAKEAKEEAAKEAEEETAKEEANEAAQEVARAAEDQAAQQAACSTAQQQLSSEGDDEEDGIEWEGGDDDNSHSGEVEQAEAANVQGEGCEESEGRESDEDEDDAPLDTDLVSAYGLGTR